MVSFGSLLTVAQATVEQIDRPALLDSLQNLLLALVELLTTLAATIAPWWPLIAWIAFWTFAVNWTKLYEVLWARGFIGVLLIAFIWVLVWGTVSPPEGGSHHLLGLTVSNFFGKLMYVTALLVIALLCGSVQLSGAVDKYLHFVEPVDDSHGDHGHGHGDGHGHDAHAAHNGHAH
jgi:hypothetical protein